MLTEAEKIILASIQIGSDNDPAHPEFPPDNPKFPATPTYQIKVPGFTNVWLKDESHNVTGTHKDRMAWEIIVSYRDFLLSKKNGKMKELPRMSIISSGSAALAIQTMLAKYKLPNLKVLADSAMPEHILKTLRAIGCEIYQVDLSRKPLSSDEILQLTNNCDGYDITSSEIFDPSTRFYDWFSYEVLNTSPEYCFVPFGTGTLYENIINLNKRAVSVVNKDPRFSGDREVLSKCNFIGATTNNPRSRAAEKLYSPHLPFVHFNEQWIKYYRDAGFCGPKSNVYILQESYLDQAIEVAMENNIACEPSGIAGLALLLQMKNQIPSDAKIVIVNTGKARY